MSGRKIANLFLAGLNQYLLPRRPLGRPAFRPGGTGQLLQPELPPVPHHLGHSVPAGMTLSFETFQTFIDELGGYLLLIILWNWGEPFLNPDLCRMIAYRARARGILTHCSTNANMRLDDARARELVESDWTPSSSGWTAPARRLIEIPRGRHAGRRPRTPSG